MFSLLGRYRPLSTHPLGWTLFQVGLFFLPSSALLSGLCLLPALVFGSKNRPSSYWKDKWNYPFMIAAGLMVLGSVRAFSGWLALTGLANWLPFFWAFWAFQPYVLTAEARRWCALTLIAGTIPVLITGFGQLFFGWEGPWELFNGLIIWFVDLGGQPKGRLSGLFDYANIAGSWLAVIWPFSLAALLQPSMNRLHKVVIFILTVGMIAALILTDSRNAWGGLIVAIPFVLGPLSWSWLFPLMVVLFIPVALAVFPSVDLNLQRLARKIVPEGFWSRLNDMQYMHVRSLESTRLNQWQVAIDFIFQKPLFGWGAAAFSVLYPIRAGLWHGHAHNLPLEIAVSHGLLVSILIVGFILTLLVVSFRKSVLSIRNYTEETFVLRLFDRAWWAAAFVLVFLHGSDMPFFDSRINMVGWILLAGLRCCMASPALKQDLDVESAAFG